MLPVRVNIPVEGVVEFGAGQWLESRSRCPPAIKEPYRWEAESLLWSARAVLMLANHRGKVPGKPCGPLR